MLTFLCFLERRHSHGITVVAARYSSEDAVILVEFVLSLLQYTKKYRPYRKVLDYLHELRKEQEENEKIGEEEQLGEQDLLEEKVCDMFKLLHIVSSSHIV